MFELLFACTDHLVSGEKFEIAACSECGLRITLDVPDSKQIGRYYESDDYISHSNTQKGFINRLYHLSRSIMLKKKAAHVTRHSGMKRGKLLDVGAGTGFFAAEMKGKLWHVSAVELNEAAREFAEQKFGIKAYTELKDVPESENNSFNAITLWHVFEHIEDLDFTMQKTHKLLCHDGVLVLALPNFQSYDAQKYGKNWAAYDVPRHLWHFSQKQVELLAKKYNFKVSGVAKMPLDAFYISMLSEKNMGTKLHFLRGAFIGLKAHIHSLFSKNRSSSQIYFLKKR